MASDTPRTGVLLLNLGTPDSPNPRDVRRYLRKFLGDPRVLDIPSIARIALVHLVILPCRSRRSSEAYAKIWTPEGSPLLLHGQSLQKKVTGMLGSEYAVELAMRYGSPAIASALERLEAARVGSIVVLPLFPQYAAATTDSVLEAVFRQLDGRWSSACLRVIGQFYAHPGFTGSLAAVARPVLESFRPDHLLMSFHGLPERQVRRSDPTGTHCLASTDCCERFLTANPQCYRAQCFDTSRRLATNLGVAPADYSVSFQSRMGRTPWLRPYTDKVLAELAERGIRRLAVICPSFVADCLETLEELGIRARAQWRELGGDELIVVPCVNDHDAWVETVVRMVHDAAGVTADAVR